MKWLSSKEYDYTTKVETKVEELVRVSRQENYYDKIKDPYERVLLHFTQIHLVTTPKHVIVYEIDTFE